MLIRVDRADLTTWIERYERLWRTEGTDQLHLLFSRDVTYRVSPWEQPVEGREALAILWEDERRGADEQFDLRYEVVAVDGDVGVARVMVDYAHGERWRDLWIIRFDADGRCREFEEWPFAPTQPDGHG